MKTAISYVKDAIPFTFPIIVLTIQNGKVIYFFNVKPFNRNSASIVSKLPVAVLLVDPEIDNLSSRTLHQTKLITTEYIFWSFESLLRAVFKENRVKNL